MAFAGLGAQAAIIPSVVSKSALSGFALPALASNPVSAGLSLLSGVGGLFGSKTKVSSATSSSYGFATSNDNNASGFDWGSVDMRNSAVYNPPLIDFENPYHVAAVAGLIVLAAVVYKKVK